MTTTSGIADSESRTFRCELVVATEHLPVSAFASSPRPPASGPSMISTRIIPELTRVTTETPTSGHVTGLASADHPLLRRGARPGATAGARASQSEEQADDSAEYREAGA